MAQLGFERRQSPRRRVDLPQGLKISTYGQPGDLRTLAAKLVDANKTGIGVEMYVPLVVGSIVAVEGDLRNEGFSMNLRGLARVVYSRLERKGIFRNGLALEEVAYKRSA